MLYCGAWEGNNNTEVGMYRKIPDFDANSGQNRVFWFKFTLYRPFYIFLSCFLGRICDRNML